MKQRSAHCAFLTTFHHPFDGQCQLTKKRHTYLFVHDSRLLSFTTYFFLFQIVVLVV